MATAKKQQVQPATGATKTNKKEASAKATAPKSTVASSVPKLPPAKKKTPAAKVAATPVKAAKQDAVKENTRKTKAPILKPKASTNNQKTVDKKNTKPAHKASETTASKKAAPEKKATPEPATVKKTASEKKVAEASKKTTPEPTPQPTPAKTTTKQATEPAPAKKAAEPAKTAASKAASGSKTAAKTVSSKSLPVLKSAPAAPKPTATPAAKPIEKKPQVIIAHRKLENKSKTTKDVADVIAPYQPETYRSILDEPVQETQSTTVYRYSDEELNEFRQLIQTRLEAARKELHYLQGLITHKDEAGTEDTENRFMNMEDGSGAMEREQLAQLASRQIQFMNHLEKALVRIENKTYGVCRVTGKLIDKARLRAVPHATLSIEAKNMMSKK
jgi:RNA polymerase-binding transcription factor DksA